MNEIPLDWLESTLGHRPRDPALFAMALTHSSHGRAHDYQRLEFLGDRVLGVTIAAWLYRLFPAEPEGKLSRRFNALVSGETCAGIARTLGIPKHLLLGKQARDDGASDSDNVLGDVVEALIGALFLEGGLDAAERFIQRVWADILETQDSAPKHPKSALQEWAAAHRCRTPVYTLVNRSGPHHAPAFTVKAEIPGRAEASAEGSSKQEAETAAAAKLLAMLK